MMEKGMAAGGRIGRVGQAMNANLRLILMGLVATASVSGTVYLYSTTLPTQMKLAQCNRSSGKTAIDVCGAVIKSGKAEGDDLAAAYFSRGNAYFFMKQYDKAIGDYDEVIRLQPDSVPALRQRGGAYLLLNRYPQALQDMDRVVKLKPDDSDSWNNRCWTRAVWGHQLDAALADCDQALKLQPYSFAALDSRALVDLRMGKCSRAVGDASGALSWQPDLAPSLYVRGLARLCEGNVKDGNADIAKAKKLDPKIAETYAGYGVKPDSAARSGVAEP